MAGGTDPVDRPADVQRVSAVLCDEAMPWGSRRRNRCRYDRVPQAQSVASRPEASARGAGTEKTETVITLPLPDERADDTAGGPGTAFRRGDAAI